MQISRRVALATSLGLGASTVAGLTPTRAYADCDTNWGSNDKTNGITNTTRGLIRGHRAGQHDCYDRFVIDIGPGEGTPGFLVRYVEVASGLGSGDPVPVLGDGVLEILVNAPADGSTQLPPQSGQTFPGYRTLRQVKSLGSFEGQTGYALGIRARLPMRAFVTSTRGDNRRMVIDIAHTW